MKKFRSLYYKLLNRIFPVRLKFSFKDEVPDKLKKNSIYIVGSNKYYWLLAFKCPCGCEKDINLNLLKDTEPCWRFKIRKENISITPSIWRITGCKSHFIINNGKINWVRNRYLND